MSLLEIDDIHVYIEGAYILQGVSMDIDEGELVALLGKNGAGKTTTLETIMGLHHLKEGNVKYKNEDVTNMEPHEISQKGIGYMPDTARVFADLTVEENLRMGLLGSDSGEERFERVFELFPFLEDFLNHTGKDLSGGEQNMLSIARAMIRPENDLLMFDEPTEGLSPENSERTMEALDEAKEEGAVILVTSNLNIAERFAERYMIMQRGKIMVQGEMEEIAEDREMTERYLGTGV